MIIRLPFTDRQNIEIETYRTARFNLFKRVMKPNRHMSILDVGGTSSIWLGSGLETNVTLLNLTRPKSGDISMGFTVVQGNALDMHMFENGQFDIVFSNSVIEHVGSYYNQRQFASEVKRVGKSYWIQTPNRHFPVEPHFLCPFFQYLPKSVQCIVAEKWPFSHFKRYGFSRTRILEELSRIRLLSESEIKSMFREARLYREDLLGITKSLVVYH